MCSRCRSHPDSSGSRPQCGLRHEVQRSKPGVSVECSRRCAPSVRIVALAGSSNVKTGIARSSSSCATVSVSEPRAACGMITAAASEPTNRFRAEASVRVHRRALPWKGDRTTRRPALSTDPVSPPGCIRSMFLAGQRMSDDRPAARISKHWRSMGDWNPPAITQSWSLSFWAKSYIRRMIEPGQRREQRSPTVCRRRRSGFPIAVILAIEPLARKSGGYLGSPGVIVAGRSRAVPPVTGLIPLAWCGKIRVVSPGTAACLRSNAARTSPLNSRPHSLMPPAHTMLQVDTLLFRYRTCCR